MDNLSVARLWGKATVGDWETYDELTAEDFELHGPGSEPLNKEMYFKWITSLKAANPDHRNNISLHPHSLTQVTGTVQLEGSHTEDWDLEFMGMGKIPASGKKWKNPVEMLVLTIRDGQVCRCDVEVPENGGIKGILDQLGVVVPG